MKNKLLLLVLLSTFLNAYQTCSLEDRAGYLPEQNINSENIEYEPIIFSELIEINYDEVFFKNIMYIRSKLNK